MLLEDIVISRVRVKLLNLFLQNPGQIYHVREIVRRTDEEINAVRRELSHMESVGMLSKEQRANRLYYSFRKDYPLYYDILSIVMKSTNLGGAILKNKVKLGKIKFAMFSGRYTRNEPYNQDKVDLLVVGQIVLPELAVLVRAEEQLRGHEINYTVMTEEEFVFRKRRRDPFIVDILSGGRLMLVGDEEEMLKISA